MSKKLLTQVVTRLVNEYAAAKEYGVSLVTIPDFNYAQLAQELDTSRCVQLFCQRQSEIVRKRRRNFVVFRRGVTKIRCFLAQKACSRFAVSGA